MDTTNPAGQTPAAVSQRDADLSAFMAAGGGLIPGQQSDQPQVSETQAYTEAPVAYDAPVVQQAEPEQQIPAEAESNEVPTSTPEVDPALQAELNRIRAERDQAAQELAQWQNAMIAETRKQQMQQVEFRRQERIDQAKEIAKSMDAEDAVTYMQRFYDDLRLSEAQEARAAMAQYQVQAEQQRHALLRKPYAEHLVQTNQLPPEYVEILSQYDGHQQDALVKGFVTQHRQAQQQQTARERELESRLRDLEASVKAQNPAFNPGGSQSSAAPVQGQRPTSRREAEIFDYLNAPVLPR